MYQNTIYICISRYSKICWFPVKKCWCQHNSRGLSRDLYIFWILFGWGITVPSFIVVGYVWQVLGRGGLNPPIREQPRKSSSWIGLRWNSIFISYQGFIFAMSLKNWPIKFKFLSERKQKCTDLPLTFLS